MKYDVIGDIHGCYDEMIALIEKLGYSLTSGVPVHPENRTLVFLGDLTDRGPKSLEVVEFVGRAVEDGACAICARQSLQQAVPFFQGKSGEAAARTGNDGGRIQKPSETKTEGYQRPFHAPLRKGSALRDPA